MKKRGRPVSYSEVRDFKEMIAKTGFIDGGFSENRFTWCNRLGKDKILERIDRSLYNNL